MQYRERGFEFLMSETPHSLDLNGSNESLHQLSVTCQLMSYFKMLNQFAKASVRQEIGTNKVLLILKWNEIMPQFFNIKSLILLDFEIGKLFYII